MLLRAMMLVGILLIGFELAPAAGLHAQAGSEQEEQSNGSEKLNPYTGDEEAIEEGQQLYMRYNCYACHGTEGGGGMGSAINDARWQFGGDDENVFRTIKEGRGRMPAQFGQILSDDEIWKIIAFMRTIYKGDPSTVDW